MGRKELNQFWESTPRTIIALCEMYTGNSAEDQERKMIEMFGGGGLD